MSELDPGLPVRGYRIEDGFSTPAEAAAIVAKYVLENGGPSRPRGMLCTEMLWVDFNVMWPDAIPFSLKGRDLNLTYAFGEIASLLGGVSTDAWQRRRAKGLAAFQDYGVQRGNYGVRVRNQLRDVVTELLHDPSSRRAVMSIYDGRSDLMNESSDVPCTLAAHAMIRNDFLHMRVTMRSNDVYLGLPYDLMQFCALQATLAEVMNVACGFYRHSVGSMHAYETNRDQIEQIVIPTVDEYEGDTLWAIPDKYDDPRDRMKYVTTFCQDALDGYGQQPQTEFEHLMLEYL